MFLINQWLATIIAAGLEPFRTWHPVVGLAAASLISALFALVVIDRTAHHDQTESVKRGLAATLLEMVIFNSQLRIVTRSIIRIFVLNLKYLKVSVVPLIATSIPILVLMTHLQGYYGYDGVKPGESALVTIDLVRQDSRADLRIQVPQGIKLSSAVAWIPSLGQAVFRVTPTHPGEYVVNVETGSQVLTKTILASSDRVSRSPTRVRASWRSFLYPAESPLPSNDTVRAISVSYPEWNMDLAGWSFHWSWLFLVMSLLMGAVLKGIGLFRH